MKKSKRMYRLGFAIGLITCPMVIFMNSESLRNIWFVSILSVVTITMISISAYAIKLEERGE